MYWFCLKSVFRTRWFASANVAGLLMLLMSIFTRKSTVTCKSANKLQDGQGCFNSHAVAVVSGIWMRPTWPIFRDFPRSEFLVCKKMHTTLEPQNTSFSMMLSMVSNQPPWPSLDQCQISLLWCLPSYMSKEVILG